MIPIKKKGNNANICTFSTGEMQEIRRKRQSRLRLVENGCPYILWHEDRRFSEGKTAINGDNNIELIDDFIETGTIIVKKKVQEKIVQTQSPPVVKKIAPLKADSAKTFRPSVFVFGAKGRKLIYGVTTIGGPNSGDSTTLIFVDLELSQEDEAVISKSLAKWWQT